MQTLQPRAYINVTPMIDVMLVLLIIFMVVVPVIAMQVDLPIAVNAQSRPEEPDEIVLIIDHHGAAFLEVSGHSAPGIALREQLATNKEETAQSQDADYKKTAGAERDRLKAQLEQVQKELTAMNYLSEEKVGAVDVIRALKACPKRSEGRRLGEDASREGLTPSFKTRITPVLGLTFRGMGRPPPPSHKAETPPPSL